MNRTKYEWPVTIERLAGGHGTSLVTFWAPANASRSTLNELAVKRARELGHATAEPFYSEESAFPFKAQADRAQQAYDRDKAEDRERAKWETE